jgi:formimidoylglutamate deiminase
MQTLWAERALLPDGWADGVRVTIGRDGRCASVRAGEAPAPGDERRAVLLPAPANVHSHAFQRAMAGLTEHRGPHPGDSFWTWRALMFRFLAQLTPDQVEAIAAFVQMELLEAGYAAVAEFHYLHHQPDGTPYAHRAEMAERIVAAAATTGIGCTLLPVHYQFGGCDGRSLGPGQRRFGTTPDDFARLHEASARALAALPPDARLGVAPHSLRAVSPVGLAQAVALAPDLVHLHLAEQVAEVAEVQQVYGARPVEWLLAHAPVSAAWCAIHATQLLPHETARLAATGAVAGVCPITEANLGDGIFDAVGWFAAGGRLGIGSDSHVRVALAEELRQLEHSQRLRDRARAVLATPAQSTGRRLFEAAVLGGAQASGRARGGEPVGIAAGAWADLLALDASQVDLEGVSGDRLLDRWIFACGERAVADVWAAGRHVVHEGRHVHRAPIEARYRAVQRALRSAL